MSEKTAAEICEEWMAKRFEYWCEFLRKNFGGDMEEQHWWQSRFLDDLPRKWSRARQEAEDIIWREYMHYVTREMAIDAGDRSMEGMEMPETVIEQCQECQGTGFEIEAQND